MYKLAVFVSGRGSNLKSILDAISQKRLTAKVEAVISNKFDCGAIEIAKDFGLNYYFVGNNKTGVFLTFEDLALEFRKLNIDLVVLAGFLKKIPNSFIDNFENKIINIHPALLPSFGGKGMYGINVHKAVFNSSAQISGPTVHFVNRNYDEGKIIAQQAIDISDVVSPEEIAKRVLQIEHKILPFVIQKFSDNKVRFTNNRVYLD